MVPRGSPSVPPKEGRRPTLNNKPRILFVSHAATRNGATILLLQILRWLRDQQKFEIEILVCGSGEMLDDFRAIGPTTVWRNPAFFLDVLPRQTRARWRPRFEALALRLRMLGRSFDLVYLNTSAVWTHAPVLAGHSRHLLWHIHEMDYALRLSMGAERIGRLFPLASRFIVVSQAVRSALSANLDVPAERMDLVHGFVITPATAPSARREARRRILAQLGWPENSFVVGGCGAMGWRKGTDLFLQMARLVKPPATGAESCFLWIGGAADGDEALRFAHDARMLGVAHRCASVATTPNVLDYYLAMDVFALTSREDPFPLVMLEAAACRVPMVCFADSGGGPEFASDNAGLVAPYLDLPAFVAHLQTLRDNPQLRQQLGETAERKVRRDFVVETQGPKVLASIERCLAGEGAKA
jgi:glycosyltransferase involved in cell wall biosynthesis